MFSPLMNEWLILLLWFWPSIRKSLKDSTRVGDPVDHHVNVLQPMFDWVTDLSRPGRTSLSSSCKYLKSISCTMLYLLRPLPFTVLDGFGTSICFLERTRLHFKLQADNRLRGQSCGTRFTRRSRTRRNRKDPDRQMSHFFKCLLFPSNVWHALFQFIDTVLCARVSLPRTPAPSQAVFAIKCNNKNGSIKAFFHLSSPRKRPVGPFSLWTQLCCN